MNRSFLVPLAIAALFSLAGCVDEGSPAGTTPPATPDPPKVWAAPELPLLDAAAFLAGHADFVTQFPIRAGNSPGHLGARDFLEQQFKDAGLEVWRQEFTIGIDQENVCGVKLGAFEPTMWIIVGGHYDTTTTGGTQPMAMLSQGAYDDGSGTWITVELARLFADYESYYSILFCAFDGEERGLHGSRAVHTAFIADPEKPFPYDDFPYEVNYTRAMLDFDMFGICWPVRAPIYFDQNDPTISKEVDAIRKDIGIPDDMFKESGLTLGKSDYDHWYTDGIPTAFFISDFEELGAPTPVPNPAPVPAVPGAYPFWHQFDTVETMTVMAGGPDMLEAGYATALELGQRTLSVLAHHPDVPLPVVYPD